MAASAIAECKLDTKVIQITNVAPGALKEQMKTLFSFLGRIEEVRMYPSEDSESQVSARVCYVRFEDASSVGVALHLTNTVFIDRALIVVPVMDGKIPDETTALQLAPSAIAGMIPGQPTWPSNVVNQMTAQGSGLVITTYDPRLTALGLAQYPPLPGTTDPNKIEEIRRTVYVYNIDKSVTAEQLMAFFSQVGEVKYIRMAGEDNLPTRSAFVEFTDQRSVATVLVYNNTMFGGRPIKVCHANSSIVKPVNKNQETAQRELEEAMKKVKEAQSLILAAVEPEIPDKKRSRSRSKSKSHRRHSRSRSKSKPKRCSRSRSRSRPRPSPKRRSRSHSRRRSASRSRRSRSRKRSPRRSRSHSGSRRHRSRSRSPVEAKPKMKGHNEERSRHSSRSRHRSRSRGRKSRSPHRKRSRSRSKRTPPKAYSSRRSRTPPRSTKRRSRSHSRQKSPVKKKYGTPSPPKLTRECSLPLKDEDKDSSPDRKSSSHEKRSRSRSPSKKTRRSHSRGRANRSGRRRSPSPVRNRRSRSRSGSRHKSSRVKKKKDQRERSRDRSSRDKESKSSKKKHKESRGGTDKEERVAASASLSSSASASSSGNKAESARVTRDYDEEEKGYVSGEGKPEKVYGAAAPPPSTDATPPRSEEDNLQSAVPSSMGDQMTSDTNLQQMDMDMSD